MQASDPRDLKTKIVRNKKKLKEVEERKGVFIEEDLTPLRDRLVRELKKEPNRKV